VLMMMTISSFPRMRHSSSDKQALVDLCLANAGRGCFDSEVIAQLGVAVRCLLFLLLAGKSEDDSNEECISMKSAFLF